MIPITLLVVLILAVAQEARLEEPPADPLEGWTPLPSLFVRSVPFVEVSVNGHGPLWFMLDTGAPYDGVDERVAGTLGVDIVPAATAPDPLPEGQITPPPTIKRPEFHVGSQLYVSEKCAVAEIDKGFAPMFGRHIDGILGTGFLRDRMVRIDFRNRTIHARDVPGYRYRGDGHVLPIVLRGYLYLQSTVTPVNGDTIGAVVLLDTGADFRYGLSRKFATDFVISARTRERNLGSVTTALGKVPSTAVNLAGIGLQGIEIEHLAAFIADYPVLRSANADGLIGTGMLRRTVLILDVSRRRAIVEYRPGDFDSPAFAGDGMAIVAEGAKLDTFVVSHVLSGSEAEKRGVRKDDSLWMINGRHASEFDLSGIEDLLMAPSDEPVRLQVLRDKKLVYLILPHPQQPALPPGAAK